MKKELNVKHMVKFLQKQLGPQTTVYTNEHVVVLTSLYTIDYKRIEVYIDPIDLGYGLGFKISDGKALSENHYWKNNESISQYKFYQTLDVLQRGFFHPIVHCSMEGLYYIVTDKLEQVPIMTMQFAHLLLNTVNITFYNHEINQK